MISGLREKFCGGFILFEGNLPRCRGSDQLFYLVSGFAGEEKFFNECGLFVAITGKSFCWDKI